MISKWPLAMPQRRIEPQFIIFEEKICFLMKKTMEKARFEPAIFQSQLKYVLTPHPNSVIPTHECDTSRVAKGINSVLFSFLGRIEETINCFQDLLTFNLLLNYLQKTKKDTVNIQNNDTDK
jgi:hypothetical protein